MKRIILGAIVGSLFPLTALAITHPPVSCTISADQTTVNRGDAVTVSWTANNSTKNVLSVGAREGGNMLVAASGSMVLHPSGSKPYILSVSAPVGQFQQCSVWITVNDAI